MERTPIHARMKAYVDEKGISHIKLLEDKENLAKLMAAGNVGNLMIMDKL